MLFQIQIFRSWDRRNFFSSDLTEKYLIFRAFWVTFSKHFSVQGKTSPPHHADFWWGHASAPPLNPTLYACMTYVHGYITYVTYDTYTIRIVYLHTISTHFTITGSRYKGEWCINSYMRMISNQAGGQVHTEILFLFLIILLYSYILRILYSSIRLYCSLLLFQSSINLHSSI